MQIKELRKQTHLSQQAFATHFGVPLRSIQEWEQKRRTPPPYVVEMMCRIWTLENELEQFRKEETN